jgi:hypothetical protein
VLDVDVSILLTSSLYASVSLIVKTLFKTSHTYKILNKYCILAKKKKKKRSLPVIAVHTSIVVTVYGPDVDEGVGSSI